MSTSTLTINGIAYDQSGRRAANYLIDGWGWDVDGGYWLEFHEHTSGPQPRINGPQSVSLSMGGTTLFGGDIVGVSPAIDGAGRRTWGYRCLGREYRAGWIPVTGNDGTGLIRFNVDPTQDPDHYVQSMAGQSVGQILSYCLSLHSSALSAAGIATDATTASALAALILVPNQEVQVAGERLWPALQGVLQQWARNIRLMVTGAGLVRLVDVTAGAGHTLTMGADPIRPPMFSRNWTSCATRLAVRGGGIIEPAYVSVLKGTLTPAWTTAEQAAWTYSDYTNPATPSTDKGTVTAVTSATTVTIKSSDATRAWAANYWDGIQGYIYLTNSAGSGLTYQEARPITSCTALSAGGTCTVTVAYDLSNQASNAYDGYQIIAANPSLSAGGLYDVWRLYDVTDPGSWVANHLVPNFPAPVPFLGYDGRSATLTTAPVAEVIAATDGMSLPFVVLPTTGQILFTRPVVEVGNSTSALNAGSYSPPTDVYCLLAYSRGALTTVYPPDVSGVPQYSGTASSQAGLNRTGYMDMYQWRYGGNSTVVNGLAQMLQVSLSNTLTEGSVEYLGLYAACQDPTGGHRLSIAGDGYTTGDESLNIPVRSYSVRYVTEGGGLTYRTTMRCSNRQDPRTGEGYYAHLSVLGSGRGWTGDTLAAGGPQFAGVSNPIGFEAAPDWSPGEGEAEAPRRRRRRSRLGDMGERHLAAEMHDAGDRMARADIDGRERQGPMTDDERDSLERVVASDNRRRASRLDVSSEDAQRRAGEEATARAEGRENLGRVVESDNRRRARRLESADDREVRLAYEAPGRDEES